MVGQVKRRVSFTSVVYHSYDSNNAAVNELVAGAYAEHTGTLGFDENLSALSRNAVENRVITQRILQDEADYLLKSTATTLYVAKADFATELNTAIQTYYPVGTIYMNDVATSVPFDFGTWQLIDEKFLYGCASDFSDIGNTGGNSTVTLVAANLPSEAISATTSSFTATTDAASTAHTHSVDSVRTYGVDGAGGNWSHSHITGAAVDASSYSAFNYYGCTSISTRGESVRGQDADAHFLINTNSVNLEHAHYVPAHDTNGMSANETHTHTLTVPSQTIGLTLGSGTAFSIIPPYHKVAIWHRTA